MSAPVRLSPVPPALVDRRKANTSVLVLNLQQQRVNWLDRTLQLHPTVIEEQPTKDHSTKPPAFQAPACLPS